jgi:DNA-binding transcriptional ArsR family regulator
MCAPKRRPFGRTIRGHMRDAFAVAGCAGGRPLTEQTREGDVEAEVELRQRMARLIGGYQLSAAIGAVARLGVADALASGPAEPQDLAARVGADARSLERILRALEDAGLFTKLDDGRIALTALGELLHSDVPESARRAAIASTEEWRWRAYGHLTHSVRTGEPGFRLARLRAVGVPSPRARRRLEIYRVDVAGRRGQRRCDRPHLRLQPRQPTGRRRRRSRRPRLRCPRSKR